MIVVPRSQVGLLAAIVLQQMYGAIQPEEVVCVIQLFRLYLRS
jgi:hypothetical protein